MRHNRAGRKLGRVSEHRRALFRNQLLSLMQHERIITTLPKAKELRPIAERMVTLGRKNTVHARRLAARWIADREVIKKLFSEIAPRFANRPGGYTRIVKLGPRKGDGAELAILEFVDYKLPEAAKEKKEQKQKKAKPEALRQEQPRP
jgi:large subunit ribosomal protein L17